MLILCWAAFMATNWGTVTRRSLELMSSSSLKLQR